MNTNTARWYVVQTQPHAEARAGEHLRCEGFITYLPKPRKSRRHARQTEQVCRALFARYMFVMIDSIQQGWRTIRSTFGFSSLVGCEAGPIPVREGIVEALRQREAYDGYLRLDTPKYERGAALRVMDGVFASCLGLFESM